MKSVTTKTSDNWQAALSDHELQNRKNKQRKMVDLFYKKRNKLYTIRVEKKCEMEPAQR